MELENYLKNLVAEELEIRMENLKTEFRKELQTNSKPYYSRKEAADYIGVCVTTIDNYIRDGRLEKYKSGRKTILKKTDLDSLLN